MKALILIVALALTACTVAPKAVPVRPASIGLSGKADSGIIGRTANAWLIDAHFRARWNDMIATWGHEREFHPPLATDEGVTQDEDGNLTLSREAMKKFVLLNGWRRAGRLPTPAPGLIARILK